MAGDINITIGAEDQATKILKQVERSTQELTKSVDRMGRVSENTAKVFSVGFKSIAGVAAGVGAAIVAIKGITAAIAGMSASVDAFNVQEEAARGMTQAQLEFAAALQVSTNVGDEATLALMRQAEMLGFTKDQSDDAALAAVGLAEALGISQEEALKKVSQAMQGNANALAESLPAMRELDKQAQAGIGAFAGLSDKQKAVVLEQQKLALVSNLAAKGLSQLQVDADSTKGIMERAAGAFGDLQEKIGAILEPIYRVVYKGFAIFAETLQGALMPAIDLVNGGFEAMQPVIDAAMEGFRNAAIVVGVAIEAIISVMGSLVATVFGTAESTASGADMLSSVIDNASRFIIGAITWIEVVLTNLPKVWELVVTSVSLYLETMRADIEHAFTIAMPEYIKWFGENALNLLTDYFNLYVTIITNFGEKLVNFWDVIFDFISSGGEGGISALTTKLGEALSGSLVEGFEAKTAALPDIAARKLTDAEQALSSKLGSLGSDLAGEFNDKFQSRVAALDANLNASVDINMPDLQSIGNLAIGGEMEVSIPQLQSKDERLLTRGIAEDPNKQTAENTKTLVDLTRNLAKDIAKEIEPRRTEEKPSLTFREVT